MKKIIGSIICLTVMIGALASFGESVAAADLYENVKSMELQLTQGDQEDLLEDIQMIFDSEVTTPEEVHQVMDVSVDRLDTDKATKIVEEYCDYLVMVFDSGKLSLSDIQDVTDDFIELLGNKIIKFDNINQNHIKVLLKKVTDKNSLLQGQVVVNYQQTLKVSGLDKMLLDVERAYRKVNTELNSHNSFKDLGRNLKKQLVLLATTNAVDLTIETDMVKRLAADNIGVSVNHNGVMYQIPTAFLEKHIGDLKIMINPINTDDVVVTENSFVGAIVDPLLLRKVSIGYATNPESISISIPMSNFEPDMSMSSSYTLMIEEEGQWTKLLSEKNYGVLTSTIKGTVVVGVGIYQPTYSDIADHWAQKNISDLLARGIAIDNNTTIYGLNDVMTRGEFVRMLINVIGTEGKSSNIFTDVPDGSTYADIIENVVFYGLTTGTTDNKFSPETVLTREEMVALSSKMFELERGYKLYGGFLKFKDMNEISPYAKDAVTTMKEAGYISGYDDNTFRPKKTVSKAEAISVIWKMLK